MLLRGFCVKAPQLMRQGQLKKEFLRGCFIFSIGE